MANVRVNGLLIELTIGSVGDLEWENAWPGGPWETTWGMDLAGNYTHPDLAADALVEIMEGPEPVWGGLMRRPKFNGEYWEFVAEGYCRLAERFGCLTSTDATTSRLDIALPEAVARGLPWTLPASLSSTPVASVDATEGVNSIAALLDAYAEEQGQRWGVTPAGLLFFAADPTEPTLMVYPGVGAIGISEDDSGSALFARYMSTAGGYATATATDTAARAYREAFYDFTEYGAMSPARAAAKLAGLIANGATKPAWTNGLELAESELSTAGGTPASFPRVGVIPELARVHGVLDPRTALTPYLDFVIGRTKYANAERGTRMIDLTPLGVVKGTTLASAIAMGDSSNPSPGSGTFAGGTDTGWIAPTFTNSWANYATGGADDVAYRRVGPKLVLRGMMKNGTLAASAFTLPAGFRPTAKKFVHGTGSSQTTGAASAGTAHTHAVANVAVRIDIDTDGTVTVASTLAGNTFVSLDGIEIYLD